MPANVKFCAPVIFTVVAASAVSVNVMAAPDVAKLIVSMPAIVTADVSGEFPANVDSPSTVKPTVCVPVVEAYAKVVSAPGLASKTDRVVAVAAKLETVNAAELARFVTVVTDAALVKFNVELAPAKALIT